MRVLLIGGSGFIGPHVVRQLVRLGHEVTVYHRGVTEADLPPDVRHVHSPAARKPVLQFVAAIYESRPAAVIHMTLVGEQDARAAVDAFRGHVGRLVAISSGDVYRAYGRFTGLEPGPPEPGLLGEASPLRTTLFPYRSNAPSADHWLYAYEKILVEQVVMSDTRIEPVVLRLPKVYGPGGNASLDTVYGASAHPEWRWTHGYVENVAAAIVLATVHPGAAGRIYNVGEAETPTVGARLRDLPRRVTPVTPISGNFAHHIAYDTSPIRTELGYEEPVPYHEGLRRTLASVSQCTQGKSEP